MRAVGAVAWSKIKISEAGKQIHGAGNTGIGRSFEIVATFDLCPVIWVVAVRCVPDGWDVYSRKLKWQLRVQYISSSKLPYKNKKNRLMRAIGSSKLWHRIVRHIDRKAYFAAFRSYKHIIIRQQILTPFVEALYQEGSKPHASYRLTQE